MVHRFPSNSENSFVQNLQFVIVLFKYTIFRMKWIFLATLIRTGQSEPDPELTEKVESFLTSDQSGHTNNWAVLVCASRYWFNYRHVANTLAVYRSVKKLGIPGMYKFSNFLEDD